MDVSTYRVRIVKGVYVVEVNYDGALPGGISSFACRVRAN